MSSVRFELRWLAPPDAGGADDRLLMQLLSGIRATGSVAGAAKTARVSYRHAWGTLSRWEQILASKVVLLERGRGATLTPLGEKLLDAELRVRHRIDPVLSRLGAELERDLETSLGRAETALRVVASHDLALLQLRDLALEQNFSFDIQIRGSSESLAAFARDECDLAGFHVTPGRPDLDLSHWLDPRRDAIMRFANRTQGLMVKLGNPKRIRALTDLTRDSVRFVNRQEGSGTRVLLDGLLRTAGLRPQQIRGYAMEEYTHSAVAATVASGMADVGFGIEAAATRHGLGFIPIASEEYLLVCRQARLNVEPISAFRKLMASTAFRTATSGLAGYDLRGAGKLVRMATLGSAASR